MISLFYFLFVCDVSFAIIFIKIIIISTSLSFILGSKEKHTHFTLTQHTYIFEEEKEHVEIFDFATFIMIIIIKKEKFLLIDFLAVFQLSKKRNDKKSGNYQVSIFDISVISHSFILNF